MAEKMQNIILSTNVDVDILEGMSCQFSIGCAR